MDPRISRYTDEYVRANLTELRALAIKYVNSYTGSFTLPIAARDRVARGDELSVTHVRAVLNCMRADPNVKRLPGIEMRATHGADRDTSCALHTSRSDRHERVVRRPSFIHLPAAWHYPYVMSTHTLARVIHALHQTKSTIVYYPHASGAFHEKFHVRLAYVCSVSVAGYRDRYPNVAFLTEQRAHELIASGERRSCPACARLASRR